jgi:hypothetical protein
LPLLRRDGEGVIYYSVPVSSLLAYMAAAEDIVTRRPTHGVDTLHVGPVCPCLSGCSVHVDDAVHRAHYAVTKRDGAIAVPVTSDPTRWRAHGRVVPITRDAIGLITRYSWRAWCGGTVLPLSG